MKIDDQARQERLPMETDRRDRNYLMAWIDLETTGLEPTRDILEVACVLTDQKGCPLLEYESPVRTDLRDAELDAWALETHSANGLLSACRSSLAPSLEEVERDLASMLRRPPPAGNRFTGRFLAGRCPSFDHSFILHHMPSVLVGMDYHLFDIWPVIELFRAARIELSSGKPRGAPHRAITDIWMAIDQYRDALGKLGGLRGMFDLAERAK